MTLREQIESAPVSKRTKLRPGVKDLRGCSSCRQRLLDKMKAKRLRDSKPIEVTPDE